MDNFAIAEAYLAYGSEREIKAQLPNFSELNLLPNAAWLAWVGIIIFTSQILFYFPAIAQTPTYNQPIYGATVNTSGGCLNARQVPSTAGDIYACVQQGEILKAIVKEENGWYQLSSGGWVSKKYVKLPSTAAPQAVKTPPTKTVPVPPPVTNNIINNLLGRNIRNWAYEPDAMLKGEEITTLQKHLNWYQLLAKPIEVTGIYDLQTKLAVEMFQKKRGMAVDGITGPDTRIALKMEP